MVLPSGETRVSSLSKGNVSSTSSEFDSLTQTGYAGMGNGGLANSVSVFKQTDVGSTDPRLVRNVATRSKDEFQCNETLNTLSTEQLVSRGQDSDVEYADFGGSGQERKSYSLAGRFARACLLHDVASPSNAGCDPFQGGYEMPRNTSQDNKKRCWSNYSDGQESCLSAQSGLETPNDGSRSGSTTDCNDIFLDASDMSLSIEEPLTPLPSELDSEAHSPTILRDCAVQNLQKNDNLCCEAVGVKETTMRDACLVRKTPEDVVGGDFDIYNIETTLPYMNWDYLEEQLQKAIKKEEMSQSQQRNDREKIRQKLAMGLDEEHFATGDRLFKKPSLQSRLHSAMNLQMCFVNEASNDAAENASNTEQAERKSSKGLCQRELSSSLLFHSLSSSSSLASSKNSLQSAAIATAAAAAASPAVNSASQEDLDFFTRQARLQAEARLALAQVRPMAHMQLQLEKQTRRKSPIADIVGIPGFGDGKSGHLSRQLLQHMNFGQLQVVVNDMHAQIEAFNSELMELLIDRDDLHMAQDSMLVDIEDLTRRAQEYDMRIKSKLVGSQNSC